MKLNFTFLFVCFSPFVFANQPNGCGNNIEAQELVRLIKADKEQRRNVIRCNSILVEAAIVKAKKMSEYGLVMHNLGGSPNSSLEKAGYMLPKHYGMEFDSNQVEALAGGYSSAQEVWTSFKRSKGHRVHLLGEHEFYKEQDEIGVAFIKVPDSPHVEYWVVYLAQGFTKDQLYLGEANKIPNKSIFMLHKGHH